MSEQVKKWGLVAIASEYEIRLERQAHTVKDLTAMLAELPPDAVLTGKHVFSREVALTFSFTKQVNE